jgi:hypothetical protein
MPTPQELAESYAREVLRLDTGTNFLGIPWGQTVTNGIGADSYIAALRTAFAVTGPNGQSILTPKEITNKLNEAGLSTENAKNNPSKAFAAIRAATSYAQNEKVRLTKQAQAQQDKIILDPDVSKGVAGQLVNQSQAPTNAAGVTPEIDAKAKALARNTGISYQEAVSRYQLAEQFKDDPALAQLILVRGAAGAGFTGEGISGAGGGGVGGGGGGYIAPPTTYDFTTIVTPQGGSEIWKRGSDGTLASTGIKVQQPLQNIGTDRNGNLVGIDPTTNKTVLVQEGYSFPQQDPSVVTITDRATGTSYALNTRTGEKRELGTYDFPQISPERTFQESATLSRLGPALTARSQDIQSAQYETDLGTKKFETIRDILANPSDYLARAFLSQGQAAPGGQITQADLINSLTNIVGAYKAPSSFEQYIGRTNAAAPIPRPAPVKASPTPSVTVAATAPTATAAPNFGGFSLQNLKDMQSKGVPSYAFTPEQRAALGITYTPTAAPTASTPTGIPQVQTPTPVTGEATFAGGATLTGGVNTNPLASVSDVAMASGGYTNEPAFIVGDSRLGTPTGYEEMIINPTGAPLKVVPNSRLPRFAEGSDLSQSTVHAGPDEYTGILDFLATPLWKPDPTGSVGLDTTKQILSSFTSPLDIALALLPGGAAVKGARSLLKASRLAKGAGTVADAAKVARASGNAANVQRIAGYLPERASASVIAMPPPASVAGYLPERASASVIPMPPPASLPKEMLRSDIKQFASTPGMFNRLPYALREARSSLVAENRPYTRSEVADLFKRNGVELTDNIWNNIKRIESTVPESLQVMQRGLPKAVNEVISGPIRRGGSLYQLSSFARNPGNPFPKALIDYIQSTGAGVTRPIERAEVEQIFANNGVKLTDKAWQSIQSAEQSLQQSGVVAPFPLQTEAVTSMQSVGIPPELLPNNFDQRLGAYAGDFGNRAMYRRPSRLGITQAFRYAEGTGYLPRYAFGSDNVVGAAGSGATGVTPSDVSMGYLSGPAYDWYDAQTGSYGYGAFNPGNPEPNVSGVATPAPAGTLPAVQGAPATPITQQSIVDMARKWSPPRVSAVLGEQQVGPMQLPVQSASYRQTSNLTPEDVKAFGTRLAAEGTSLTDYSALQKGLFGAKRTSRRGRLVI